MSYPIHRSIQPQQIPNMYRRDKRHGVDDDRYNGFVAMPGCNNPAYLVDQTHDHAAMDVPVHIGVVRPHNLAQAQLGISYPAPVGCHRVTWAGVETAETTVASEASLCVPSLNVAPSANALART